MFSFVVRQIWHEIDRRHYCAGNWNERTGYGQVSSSYVEFARGEWRRAESINASDLFSSYDWITKHFFFFQTNIIIIIIKWYVFILYFFKKILNFFLFSCKNLQICLSNDEQKMWFVDFLLLTLFSFLCLTFDISKQFWFILFVKKIKI